MVLSHDIVRNVLTSRSALRTLGDQLRWMKSTVLAPGRTCGYRPDLRFALRCDGIDCRRRARSLATGIGLLALACLNRMIQSVAVGWGVARDPRAVRLCWLYPLRDLFGFVAWALSYTSRDFYWRGETYRFGKGGRIAPLERAS